MNVAKIDPYDRLLILLLNDHAANFRKMTEVATGRPRDIYLVGLGAYQARMETALEAAIRRCAA